MRTAIRQLNYFETENSFEVQTGESETVPNQAFTIKEVLDKFQVGSLPSISKKIYYESEVDFDNVNPTEAPDFDLADATILNDQILDQQKHRVAEAEQQKKIIDQQKADTLAKQSDATTEAKK